MTGPGRVLVITGAASPAALHAECMACFDAVVEIAAPSSEDKILLRAAEATDYVLGGPEYLGARMLAGLPRLRRVVLLGTGVPSFIDEAEAARRNIEILNTPHMNADSVAEFAVGMMIMAEARAFASAEDVRNGAAWRQGPWRTLPESRIGLVGLGYIGEAVARRLRAIGAGQIGYFSRARRLSLEAELGLQWRPIEALIQDCDRISFHVSYTPQTHELIDDRLLAHGHADLSILCFSNPRIIDPSAARRALTEGRLGHLYMDGYYREWTANQGTKNDLEKLLTLPTDQFTATSHIAAQTFDAIDRQLSRALALLFDR